ncbi:SURF1 family protein [Curtobacterium sp. S6]|uniref:SURF1 family protein n=1 Tax=Curtobacterium sp. S6 TaxID=1479623 RepID=UPI0004AA9C08|nr:SURF1 family protein [Curtobacterium sp. S6]
MLKLAFTPRWLGALVLALALATGFMLLSQWQLGSADSHQINADPAKETVQPLDKVAKPLSPVLASQADSMVSVTGHYVEHSSRLVENRVNDGTKGYWVVSQLQTDQTAGQGSEKYSVAVARGFTTNSDPTSLGAEPTWTVTVTGRLVANEGPVTTRKAGSQQILGSAATAQLTNIWDAPLYAGTITATSETPEGQPTPLTQDGRVRPDASLTDPQAGMHKIHTEQVVDHSVNWLNIFYAIEWVVFAIFAVFLWWRLLSDEHERMTHPEKYYEFAPEGSQNVFLEEDTGRHYYYDSEHEQYYYFDESDATETTEPTPESAHNQQRGNHGDR